MIRVVVSENNVENALVLLDIAEADLRASDVLLNEGLFNQAIFMAEQACEKTCKAIMLYRGVVSSKDLSRRIGHEVSLRGIEVIRRYLDMQVSGLLKALDFLCFSRKLYEIVVKDYLPEQSFEFNEVRVLDDVVYELRSHLEYLDKLLSEIKRTICSKKLRELLLRPDDGVRQVLSKLRSNTFEKFIEFEVGFIKQAVDTLLYSLVPVLVVSDKPLSLQVDEVVEKLLKDKEVAIFIDELAKEIYLSSMLSCLMAWSYLFEPFVSSVRYSISPVDIEEESAIVVIAKEFVRYMYNDEVIPVIKAFISDKIKENEKASKICFLLINILKEKIKFVLNVVFKD